MRAPLALALLLALTAPAAALDFREGADESPHIVGPDGRYLGNLNSNPFDENSVANPFGRYGSETSPDSVNNPFGRYGNPNADPDDPAYLTPFFKDDDSENDGGDDWGDE